MGKPWTEKHRQEALRRTYEIAAELAAAGRSADAAWLAEGAAGYAETEDEWRYDFGDTPGPGLTTARIDREVRRVRGLAEGRLVRWQGWQGTSRDGGTMGRTSDDEQAQRWRERGAKVVRVTCIRRAR